MSLRKYNELGTVYRGEPCLEFPGEWICYYPDAYGKEVSYLSGSESFSSFEEAISFAKKKMVAYEDERLEYNPNGISICWACNDNDPRIGMIWFTPFYCAGRYNIFGQYRET